MEKKLNIAKILSGKPQGTLLHSDIYGRCKFWDVNSDDQVRTKSEIHINGRPYGGTEVFLSNGQFCDEGKMQLFPSDKMRDWFKFGWTKGTVLESCDKKARCIFVDWMDDDYMYFKAAYKIEYDENGKAYESLQFDESLCTLDYDKVEDEDKHSVFIGDVERLFGGKLNQTTLEVEKPTYNVGDFLVAVSDGKKFLLILDSINEADTKEQGEEIEYYVMFDVDNKKLTYNKFFHSGLCEEIRLANEEEKNELEGTLFGDGKIWDKDENRIKEVKVESGMYKSNDFKFFPFELVLVRNSDASNWVADLFSHIEETKENLAKYRTTSGWYRQCISYAGHEDFLGTDKSI